MAAEGWLRGGRVWGGRGSGGGGSRRCGRAGGRRWERLCGLRFGLAQAQAGELGLAGWAGVRLGRARLGAASRASCGRARLRGPGQGGGIKMRPVGGRRLAAGRSAQGTLLRIVSLAGALLSQHQAEACGPRAERPLELHRRQCRVQPAATQPAARGACPWRIRGMWRPGLQRRQRRAAWRSERRRRRRASELASSRAAEQHGGPASDD